MRPFVDVVGSKSPFCAMVRPSVNETMCRPTTVGEQLTRPARQQTKAMTSLAWFGYYTWEISRVCCYSTHYALSQIRTAMSVTVGGGCLPLASTSIGSNTHTRTHKSRCRGDGHGSAWPDGSQVVFDFPSFAGLTASSTPPPSSSRSASGPTRTRNRWTTGRPPRTSLGTRARR